MSRITEKNVRYVFDRYCAALGVTPSHKYGDGGDLALDHNSAYGGWSITNASGSDHPLGHFRMSTSEFYEAMQFAIKSLEYRGGAGYGHRNKKHRQG
jgi:hypothetical protein